MVTLLKQFIEAERTGNWKLHLDTVRRMLPYFHAAGHFLYAKSGHLYLQDMLRLEERMDPSEFEKFTTEGHFTVRRSEKFWSGIWSDMTIEQTLMKTMKSSGGLTSGRGMTDSVLTRWTLGMVHMQNICEEIEAYCEVSGVTSEQHVDARSSRIDRDGMDSTKLRDWFLVHPPFPENDVIMSISSGLVGGEDVNCHKAQEVGEAGVKRIIGDNFQNVKFHKKDKVVTLLTVVNTIKAGNTKVTPVDPLTLFQRVCLMKQSDEDLENLLRYELAPYPMSLFSEEGMRKGTKSSFYNTFVPVKNVDSIAPDKFFVIDGGYLLHKVTWPRDVSFKSIAKTYVSYVQRHFGSQVAVVFDGYPSEEDQCSTKSAERFRRSTKHSSAEVVVEAEMVNQVPQDKFLSNEQNKNRLITLLKTEFRECSIQVDQAQEDADVMIVTSAISRTEDFGSVVIVGEDVDLLVLMTGLGQQHENLFFQKPGRGGAEDKWFSTTSYKFESEDILFTHAISGCDTTSALFGQGKIKFCNTINKHQQLKAVLSTFKNPDATPEEVIRAGEQFVMTLYSGGVSSSQTLDALRYQLFAKSATKSKLNLARLPPTKDAAQHHSLRSYQQVQTWMGNLKHPEEWGWTHSNQGLRPVAMSQDPAPESILHVISCSCKMRCGRACTCRKADLKCSSICKKCSGVNCENVPDFSYEKEDEMDPVDIIEDFDAEINELEDAGWMEEARSLMEEQVDLEATPSASADAATKDISEDTEEPGPSKRRK